MNERQLEEDEDIYHTTYHFQLQDNQEQIYSEDGVLISEAYQDMQSKMGRASNFLSHEHMETPKTTLNTITNENGHSVNVVLRRGPRRRKAANVVRSSSTVGSAFGGELRGRRPLSMSCLMAKENSMRNTVQFENENQGRMYKLFFYCPWQ